MNVLIVKLDATGDVVRTTPLLRLFAGNVTWVTAQHNAILLNGLSPKVECVPWESRDKVLGLHFDLAINLEDDVETAAFVRTVRHRQLFGAYLDGGSQLKYTDDAKSWFDMSLISIYGRQKADALKFVNRRTYQDLVFEGLGFRFNGEPYLLPAGPKTDLSGDVAIAPVAGPVWPMKNWVYFDELKQELQTRGLRVNVLPRRASLLEHLTDVRNHLCLVSGDSLPMHLALGTGTPCVTIFSCTSPWEIHDYGLQTKIVSPLLGEFFYKRDHDPRATAAIGLDVVLRAVLERLETHAGARKFASDM
jgi:heptosyltransferase II